MLKMKSIENLQPVYFSNEVDIERELFGSREPSFVNLTFEISNISTIQKLGTKYDAILHVVSHKEFLDLDLNNLKSNKGIVYDVKGILGEKCDAKL